MWKASPSDQRVDYLHTSYKNIYTCIWNAIDILEELERRVDHTL